MSYRKRLQDIQDAVADLAAKVEALIPDEPTTTTTTTAEPTTTTTTTAEPTTTTTTTVG